jgi:hypothetical protein
LNNGTEGALRILALMLTEKVCSSVLFFFIDRVKSKTVEREVVTLPFLLQVRQELKNQDPASRQLQVGMKTVGNGIYSVISFLVVFL